MKARNVVILLVIAGILAIIAGIWSGSGAGLGPVRQGEGAIAAETRSDIMAWTLIGGIGAFLTAIAIKFVGRIVLGIASLVFGAFQVPALFQANVLSILSICLLVLVGVTLLARPVQKVPGHVPE